MTWSNAVHARNADYTPIEGTPVHRLIELNARMHPDRVALRHEDRTYTYALFNATANQFATLLSGHGVVPGMSVAVLLDPCPSSLICQFALLKLGAVYVPVDVEHPPARIDYVLAEAKPALVVTRDSFAHLLPATSSALLFEGFDDPRLQGLPIQDREYTPRLEDPAYVFFTSGTTGKPKGVIGTQLNLHHYTTAAVQRFEMGPHTIMPTIARLTFSISLFDSLCPLVAGGTVVVVSRDVIMNIEHLTALLMSVTMVHMGPSLLNLLMRHLDDSALPPEKFDSLQHVSSGGDLVKGPLLEKLKHYFTRADIFVVYGCTEIACMGCNFAVPRHQTISKTWIGKPFGGVNLVLLDDQLNPVNNNIPGMIHVSGPGVTQGYLNQSALTANRYPVLNGQRYYNTGDLGIRHLDGNIEILGRQDYQIQLHGIRIEPGEIEYALSRIPGIKESVVWYTNTTQDDINLVAYLVIDTHSPPSRNQITDFLKQQLPKYMIPSQFVVLAKLPVNFNLKLDRAALPAPDATNTLRSATLVEAPTLALEASLLAIWKMLFRRDDIGVIHDFFELGGDSLMAIDMLALLNQEVGKKLPITAFLRAPTIRDLTRLISDDILPPASDLVVLKQGTQQPTLFLVHGALVYRELADHLPSNMTVCALYRNDEADYIQQQNVTGMMQSYSNIEAMAEHYIHEIRRFQPTGPYYLAGYSIGGLMAYEIARKLRDANETVGDLILIDTHTPAFLKRGRLKKARYHLQRLLSSGLPHFKYLIWKIVTQISLTRAPATNLAPNPQHNNRDEKEELRRLARHKATTGYVPRAFGHNGLLLKASERVKYEAADLTLGWNHYLKELAIRDIPGDHYQILTGDSAIMIALLITQQLSSNSN